MWGKEKERIWVFRARFPQNNVVFGREKGKKWCSFQSQHNRPITSSTIPVSGFTVKLAGFLLFLISGYFLIFNHNRTRFVADFGLKKKKKKNQLKSSSNNKNHQLKVELSKKNNNKKFQVAALVNHTHVAKHVAMDDNGEKTDGEDENPEFSLYGQWRLPLKHHPSNLFHFFFFFFSLSLPNPNSGP